ncbi:Exocyst complex component S5 [Elasticomyces elasticus]|nr:Exocyst complex component S5 [Elasticomyces elasticus]
MAAEIESRLLNHYRLTTLYPSEWPARDGDDDLSDSDSDTPGPDRHTSLSKLSALDRHGSLRSHSSTFKNPDAANLVQKDEPDPLGLAPSVLRELRQRHLPVEDDLRLRNRFMLSSTTFSPALFLSQVHQTASTEDLLRGLETLGRSIEKKSASLKVLVESNFERFVRAKATIDNVYTEMRTQGAEPEAENKNGVAGVAGRRPHSRHTSKGQSHFRSASGALSPMSKGVAGGPEKRKNALVKESEYGVLGIKAPLIEVAIKAEEVWGPALGGKEKEEGLKAVLAAVEQNKGVLEVGGAIRQAIRQRDYDTVLEKYAQAREHALEAKSIADAAVQENVQLEDPDIHQIVVTARMWSDVGEQITKLKRDVWKRLVETHFRMTQTADERKSDAHMELIAVLLQLGVDENPIWVWLQSRYDHLRNKLARTMEHFVVELEIMRRKLANVESPPAKALLAQLRAAEGPGRKERGGDLDSPAIVTFWERMLQVINGLLSHRDGLLAEVIEFWETSQSFIDGRAQKSLPIGIDGQSRVHHRLSEEKIHQLRSGATELITFIREKLLSFFADPPVDDISALVSPVPQTPTTPGSASTLSPNPINRSTFDPNNIPPPSPIRGSAWEAYAFWPPNANVLSGVHYLSRALVLINSAASEMADLSISKSSRKQTEDLKALISIVRERCVAAVCSAWTADVERCRTFEDWTRYAERRDLTNFPARFMAFEEYVLGDMQRMLYISEAVRGGEGVVVPPSAKLLSTVRVAFVGSLYKALSGMVENAEKNIKGGEGGGEDPEGLTVPLAGASGEDGGRAFDASARSVRMLLTLSNLSYLRSETIPHLLSTFETSFTVKLTDESKTIRDALTQIDARLFQAYVKPKVDKLAAITTAGIADPAWVPKTARPDDARPYVYEVLLSLVLVHTEVSTSSPTLTNQILSYLLEQSSAALISAFRQRARYTLPALMQATLDVEFIAQTLNNYTTERAGETQSQIYLALDERTDNDARVRLQAELPEMRALLKRLREGTKGVFGCFKRERRGRREERGGGGGAR